MNKERYKTSIKVLTLIAAVSHGVVECLKVGNLSEP